MLAKDSHEVSSVGRQLVQDQALAEFAIAARLVGLPVSLLGEMLLYWTERPRSETAPIYRSHPPSQAVRHLEKRFGPLAARALTSEISVSLPTAGMGESVAESACIPGRAVPAAAAPVIRTGAPG